MSARVLLLALGLATAGSAELTAGDVLARVDQNSSPKTSHFLADLTIDTPAGRRVLALEAFAEGSDKSYIFFLKPRHDSGTCFLKLGTNLWLYLPSVRRTIRLSGAMLRQSALGSDFSYEDLTLGRRLADRYATGILRSDTLHGRPCYVLELTARTPSETYQRVRLWIDRERFVPVRQELMTRTGLVLKSMEETGYEQRDAYYLPTRVVIEDHLRRATRTLLTVRQAEFDLEIPARRFLVGNLGQQ